MVNASMNTNTPASKAQKRALALLDLSIAKDSYVYAQRALEAAGVNDGGIPYGHTWRTAAKLSDETLLELLRVDNSDSYYISDPAKIAEGGY